NNKQFWNSEDDALTAVVTDIYEAIENFTYENQVELEKAEKKVAEALEDAQIENSPPPHQKVVPPKTTKGPHIERPRTNAAPPRGKQQVHQQKSKRNNNATMDVEWRNKYYKNVLWKRA